jgi:lincosamide nucleotidyltransferase A/C/D/E
MVSARDAVRIIERLAGAGTPVWVCGGWGIDALLERETRSHKDLDILVQLDDIVEALEVLEADGCGPKELWSENLCVTDSRGVETDTAFVLEDEAGHQIDLHAISLRPDGSAAPAYDGAGMDFRAEDLFGEGAIGELRVRCLSVEMQSRGHNGYELPERQIPDLELLRERYGDGQANRSLPVPATSGSRGHDSAASLTAGGQPPGSWPILSGVRGRQRSRKESA